MGFCQSWVSLRGATQDTLCAELGLQRTGTFNEVTDAPFSGRQLRTGWALVVMDGSSSALDGTVDLARLSKLGDVVACFVEEHVMCSTAAFWSGGRECGWLGTKLKRDAVI